MMKKHKTPSVSPSRGGMLSRRFQQIAKCAGAIILGSVALLGASSLSSCSDELDYRVNNGYEKDPGILTLQIPDVESAAEYGAKRSDAYRNTRAGETATEGSINSLWVLAYPETSGKSPIITKLTENELNVGTDKEYKSYSIPGFEENEKYHIYVVANLDDYADKTISTSLSEDELQDLVLNFTTNKKLEKGNLPMACLNTEIEGVTTGGSFTFSSTNRTAKANLKFLCAKVRFTILFDNTTGGFSSDFSTTEIRFDQEVKVSKVQSKTPLTSTLSSNDFLSDIELTLNKVKYPNSGVATESGYLRGKETAPIDGTTDLEIISTDWTTAGQKAWQMVVYLPENIQSTTEDTNKTTLTFNASSGSEQMQPSYSFALITKEKDPRNQGITRGHFYDIISRLTHPSTVDFDSEVMVEDWTTQSLSYTLHGPYELIVEKSEIPVSTDTWTVVGYDSDTSVTFDSPEYSSTGLPLYTVEKITPSNLNETLDKAQDVNKKELTELSDEWPNYFRVKVNESIPVTQLQQNLAVPYFHVVAGSIHKKIACTPLDLKPYFNVYPNKITIDVREYTNSGKSSDEITISYSTNLDISSTNPIKVSHGGNYNLVTGEGYKSPNYALRITDENGNLVGTTDIKINNSKGELVLNVKDILGGNTYWDSKHTYTLTFTPPSGSTLSEEKVEINVIPYSTDYIIHFKCKNFLWENPHIYVYQCLEFPNVKTSDLKYTIKDCDDPSGKTVGYHDWDDASGYNADLSGLEYMFSNNISFKGWKNFGGSVDYDVSGSEFSGGFIQLGGVRSKTSTDFAPAGNNTNIYDYSKDLNVQHYNNKTSDNWYCTDSQCASSSSLNNGGKRGWPGVAMEYEGNGWWKYTLTGIATPGKAMIMFTNQHITDPGPNLDNRFPANAEVGIPLFDFPDHEGWFLCDTSNSNNAHNNKNQNFYDDGSIDDGPDQEMPTSITYRFYWPQTAGKNAYLVWPGGSLDWNNTQRTQTYKTWYYYDFTVAASEKSKSFTYKVADSFYGSNQNFDNGLNSFIESDGVYHAYVDNFHKTNLQGGLPNYYIYFQDQDNKASDWRVHIWKNNGGDYTTWPDNDSKAKLVEIKTGIPEVTDNNKGTWYRVPMPTGYDRLKVHDYDNNKQTYESGEYTISDNNSFVVGYWNNNGNGWFTR